MSPLLYATAEFTDLSIYKALIKAGAWESYELRYRGDVFVSAKNITTRTGYLNALNARSLQRADEEKMAQQRQADYEAKARRRPVTGVKSTLTLACGVCGGSGVFETTTSKQLGSGFDKFGDKKIIYEKNRTVCTSCNGTGQVTR